ncbi:MAG: glucose-6-phosphate isomerase, partial [Desulfobacula sp.]|nr:glucose-6-phosphate isomerase [Desulfobacula sp.]
MGQTLFNHCNAYQNLSRLSKSFTDKKCHLRNLIQEKDRLKNFSLKMEGFFYDFSKQRMDYRVLEELLNLAVETKAKETFSRMTAGDIVNVTENRAALHTAARDFTHDAIWLNDVEVISEMNHVNQQIKAFSEKIHHRQITGMTGKPFTDAVVIGIGGSYLGCEFVYTACKQC